MQPLRKAPRLTTTNGAYVVRLAVLASEIRHAQALRFGVFNVELNKGRAGAFAAGLDNDEFDAVCDHLLVEHIETGVMVGI